MENLVTIIHVLAAAGVIGLVLLQHGKGADMGAAFGSGASGSLFGVSGSSNFMSKATAICVTIFFATSLTLAYMTSHRAGNGSVVKVQEVKSEAVKPAETKPLDTKPVETTPSGNASKDVPN
ncbi:MAG: preprotein translocase subunit SecG [Methylotenera sp.]